MRVGVPTEVKNNEYRVALTPAGASELTRRGHEVLVQAGAGLGSAITDAEYAEAGAQIVPGADDTWGRAELVLKVKEPVAEEFGRLRPGLTLFTYLHLASAPELTRELLDKQVTGIAYETVQTATGELPLLAPMSEVAGRLAPQAGAYQLMRPYGGRGVLPGGVPGVAPARVVVIGAGVAGMNAAQIAVGMGADVSLLDLNVDKLRAADKIFGNRVRTLVSTPWEVEQQAVEADMIIGAVLIPGAKAPTVIPHSLVQKMKPGAVLVDISIDQGGCFEDSRPTTHSDPTYRVGETIFYCVANMPGAVPHTSTRALTNVTLPYAAALADRGTLPALRSDPALARGLNTHGGRLTEEPVGAAFGIPVTPQAQVLAE